MQVRYARSERPDQHLSIYKHLKYMCTILETVHRNQVAAQMQASEFQKI